MHSAKVSLIIAVAALPAFAAAPTYRVTGTDAMPWGRIFESIGIANGKSDSGVVVAGAKEQIDVAKLAERHIVVLEGNTATCGAWDSFRKHRW
jgi:hypothetical protein